MTTFIHQTAIVAPGAKIGEGCHVGPFCTIGEGVELGSGVRLDSHVVVVGRTTVGDEKHNLPFSKIGLSPHELK